MREITKDVVHTEIIGYEANDGTYFKTENACREYEASALAAARNAFNSIASKSCDGCEFHDLFCICYEDDMRVVEIKDATDLQIVNTYLCAKAPKEPLVDPSYIGKRCLISFMRYDNTHAVIGTREEMQTEFNKFLDKLFGLESEE